jgi:hypothetical protein
VNNSRLQCGKCLENIGDSCGLKLIVGVFSREQPVHINLWAETKFLIESSQFIERTKRAAAGNSKAVRFRIIPGDWGKVGSGWLTRLLKNRSASSGEAEFTSSSGGVRAPSNANEGLGSKRR